MAEQWLSDKLFSIDEKVRVERGPRVIELPCTDENLSDEVTFTHYKIGGRDVTGRLIRPDECPDKKIHEQAKVDKRVRGIDPINKGDTMQCADWRERHFPWNWKIYQKQEFVELDEKTGEDVIVYRFVKIKEVEGVEDAIEQARKLAGGMQ